MPVWITEYKAGSFAGIQAPIADGTQVAQGQVAVGGVSNQSAAFSGDTRLIEVTCNEIVSIRVGGTNPVATINDTRFFAGRVSYYVVNPGDKLAVIANV